MKLKYSKVYELQPDPYDCTQKKHLRICLFKDVKNSGTLCELVRSGEIDAAIIKAELVSLFLPHYLFSSNLSIFQVAEPFILLAAANRAIHQAAHNRMFVSCFV
jgi:hypothetical protein